MKSPTQKLLTPLCESIVNKPPYMNGTLRPSDSCFSLYYRAKKDGKYARYINLANATLDELEQLSQACEPAAFGVNEKGVLDEAYCEVGKMDPDHFAALLDPVRTGLIKAIRDSLLEGRQSRKYITAKLHKLNVYSKGSFVKSHVDTPHGEEMFGSLVVVFPTPHEGGALLLRYRGREWMFDSGHELAAEHQPSIGYVAFFSDVEHEVAPVISGHRVTLTYNLYFGNGGELSSKVPVSEHLSLPPAANEKAFCGAVQRLLENPEFLPYGGTLAFGPRHAYPVETDLNHPSPLEHIYGALTGSDGVVYQTFRALGFQPVLYMYYEWTTPNNFLEAAVIDKYFNFNRSHLGNETPDITMVVRDEGGIVVSQEGWGIDPKVGYENPERVDWVTPVTTFNRVKDQYALYCNEIMPSVGVAYSNLCLFVRIGKAGERLVYPTVSQLEKERKREPHTSQFWKRWTDW